MGFFIFCWVSFWTILLITGGIAFTIQKGASMPKYLQWTVGIVSTLVSIAVLVAIPFAFWLGSKLTTIEISIKAFQDEIKALQDEINGKPGVLGVKDRLMRIETRLEISRAYPGSDVNEVIVKAVDLDAWNARFMVPGFPDNLPWTPRGTSSWESSPLFGFNNCWWKPLPDILKPRTTLGFLVISCQAPVTCSK